MKKQIISIIKKLLFSALIILFVRCNNEDANPSSDSDVAGINKNNEKTFKFKNKLFSIPSPFVASELIGEIDADFNPDLLNPVQNKINYATTDKKALNLGIYTADLAYANLYDQFSETSAYIKVVRSLSSDLQILNAYTDELLEDFENNLNDKDSLNKIFTDAYRETDLYLAKNNRNDIADLIVTGAWAESMFLMTQIAKENHNKKLIERIGEQKYTLKNLLNLLKEQNPKKENTKQLEKKLEDLYLDFKKIEIKYEYYKQIIVPDEQKTIILSETKIEITPELLNNITRKTKEIRTFIIK